MKSYFPDTNFFFECRKASDLPWRELDPASPKPGPDIRLVVPSTVITEIERHKAKGNSRTAKRAREASALLRKALKAENHEVDLRSEKPRVVLALPPVVKTDFSTFPNLDEKRPDHRIAAEYAEVQKLIPELTPLSDDTLLILAFRSLGVDPVLVPESWKLPPENDERDDEIAKLRNELSSLKASYPDLSFVVLDDEANEVGTIEKTIGFLEPTDADIAAAVTQIKAAFPMKEEFGEKHVPAAARLSAGLEAMGKTWMPPRTEEIEAYRTAKYPQWVEAVRRALPRITEQSNQLAQEIPFSIAIANRGFVNAEYVRLTLTGFDGVMFVDELDEEEAMQDYKGLRLPAPPPPPQGRYISTIMDFAPHLDFLGSRSFDLGRLDRFHQTSRNPNAFYYVDGRPAQPVEEMVLTCEAFPHQGDGFRLAFRLWLDDELGSMPRLRVRLEARNLRKPLETYVKVKATRMPADFQAFVDELKRKLA